LKADAPLAFLALDVDLYTASVEVLEIFRADISKLAPVVPIWVDDSNINIMQTKYAGEALAITHFNEKSEHRKIDHKIIRTNHAQKQWHHCFYFAHMFDHPIRSGEQNHVGYGNFFHVSY
jgi:hypothetical protein